MELLNLNLKFHCGWVRLIRSGTRWRLRFVFVNLLSSDYGVDRSGVWEQRPHQHRWGSQLPEVPPLFLHSKPFIPPHRGRLGFGLQPWPEGETEFIPVICLQHHTFTEICSFICCMCIRINKANSYVYVKLWNIKPHFLVYSHQTAQLLEGGRSHTHLSLSALLKLL